MTKPKRPKNIILRPVITERVYNMIEDENKLVFEIAKGANKAMVKKAIKELYNRHVKKVNTYITPKGVKRAICSLSDDENAYDLAVDLGLFG